MATRTCLVPDLDGELTGAVRRLEELLLSVDGSAAGDPMAGEEEIALPAPLADRAALEALRRLGSALRPTQGLEEPRLYGPDGRHEHLPLRLVDVDQADLGTLAAAAAVLGRALLPGAGAAARWDPAAADLIREVLGSAAEVASTPYRRVNPQDLIASLARVVGLLDLERTADTEALHTRLTAAGGAGAGDVVLTPAEEAAYQRVAGRLNAMWADSSPIDRFLY